MRGAVPLVSAAKGCPVTGEGGDSELNQQKNRTDMPGAFEKVDLDDLIELEAPKVTRRHRAKWSNQLRTQVDAIEKRAVTVEGYLIATRESGAEACNCGSTDDGDKDYHLWLAEEPDTDKADAMVVEITPRMRQSHKTDWSIASINRYVKKNKVRVSGWLLIYYEEHPNEVGKSRATIVEVHPIMKIEVLKKGIKQSEAAWQELK